MLYDHEQGWFNNAARGIWGIFRAEPVQDSWNKVFGAYHKRVQATELSGTHIVGCRAELLTSLDWLILHAKL